jgi:hypothetical protein
MTVYVVTAWDEKTGHDTILVFAKKIDADRAWKRLVGATVYGGVSQRKVR